MIASAFAEAALSSSNEALCSAPGWSVFSMRSIGRPVRPGATPLQASAISVGLSAGAA